MVTVPTGGVVSTGTVASYGMRVKGVKGLIIPEGERLCR
jgi:hypothetical protein